MIANQELKYVIYSLESRGFAYLARPKLVGIHHIDENALSGFTVEILSVELGGHRAPDFRTLYARQVTVVP